MELLQPCSQPTLEFKSEFLFNNWKVEKNWKLAFFYFAKNDSDAQIIIIDPT